MDSKQKILYKKLQEELSAQVIKDGKLIIEDVEVILKRLIRLVQICSNPRLVDERYNQIHQILSTKKIIDKAISENSKVIVWTNFVDNVEWICNYFNNEGIVGISGNVKPNERDYLISELETMMI